ncbi:MAG TPA: SDR family oxidoreductase [Firmicutes bacterium]|jgi:2-deoxy-D-gluconate 3-dehydrogenase|nr:SDR family oxidoreductase [Bacillota bacterium]
MKMFDLSGKLAVVTGANRGLGLGMAKGLAEAGADIVCISRSGKDEKAREIIEGLGRRFHSIQLDVTELDKIFPTIEQIVRDCGRLDIMVNNAGIISRHPAEEFPLEEWHLVTTVLMDAVFYFCQAAGRQMLKQGKGKIINTASVLSFQGGILCAPYAAAKAAISNLTRALANEWASKGINVNCIAPGYFDTDLIENLKANPERSRALLARIPAGRWGTIDELAGAVVYLASDASNYVHGHTLAVDGGWLSR